MSIKRALISVSDKNGLASFAAGLAELGDEIPPNLVVRGHFGESVAAEVLG